MIYDFPAIERSRERWRIRNNSHVHPSGMTQYGQVVDFQGEVWEAEIEWDILDGADRAELAGFLAQLRGQNNAFRIHMQGAPQRGILTGTPLIKGAGQLGRYMRTDGWTTSQTGIVKRGDVLEVGNYMYQVCADADSDSSGNATIEVNPRMRASPSDNAALAVSSVCCVMRLAVPITDWPTNNLTYSEFKISAVQDITLP